jgi:predicted Zn-dependent protease with MMP-like domain
MNMDKDKLEQLAENAIADYFEGIESIVDNIVSKIADEQKIEDEDEIYYLKVHVRLGILKWK